MLTLGIVEFAGAQPSGRAGQLSVDGRVVSVHSSRLFTLREAGERGRELVVLAPRRLSPALVGATVRVDGVMRPLTRAEMDLAGAAAFAGRSVLVATSFLATLEEEAEREPDLPTAREPAPPVARAVETRPSGPMEIRASTLVSHLDGFAGQRIRVRDVLVVGVLAPNAFLVEPATEYLKTLGFRDRVVVLVADGALRVPSDLLVGSRVVLEGVARTILGVRLTGEVPWPARLDADTMERLEVRAALLVTSVRTADAVELTDRPSPNPLR